MKKKLLFLGTGGSSGIPIIGCDCIVCSSTSKFNKRLRSSVLIQTPTKNILIDPGPDFRQQALTYNIRHIDATIITHVHYDHIGGLDDLRIFYFIQNQPIHCLLSKASFDEIRLRYFYQFLEPKEHNSKTVKFEYLTLPHDRGSIDFHGMHVQYLTYYQGDMPVLGIRIGNLAYISDIKTYPETIFEDLKGVETLIVSGLRNTSSNVHFTIDEAVEFADNIKPKRVYINHIDHELEHELTNRSLPSWVQLSYDGLQIEFE